MLDVLSNFAVKACFMLGCLNQFTASCVLSWYNILPFLSFFAPMNEVSVGQSVASMPIRSRAVFAFVMSSFSVRLLRVLSALFGSVCIIVCLSVVSPLVMTMASAVGMFYWAITAYVVYAVFVGCAGVV
jgi:hypothetical protein